MSEINRELVEYVAELAHLDLDESAKARLVDEMNEILDYMNKLNALDTTDVEPMMHAMPLVNVYREDVVGESLPREVALQNAPRHDNEYFLVPKILDTEEA